MKKAEKAAYFMSTDMRHIAPICRPMSPHEMAPFRAVVPDGIQDFTIRVRVLNFRREMAGNKRFSGESGREPRRIFHGKRLGKRLDRLVRQIH